VSVAAAPLSRPTATRGSAATGRRKSLPHRLALHALTVVLAALLLSVWVGIDGQAFGRFAQATCNANHYALESFCWYVPEFSVLWTPFVFDAHLSWPGFVLAAYAVGVTAYVAYPLLRQWTVTAYRDLGLAWAAYRGRSPWGF